LACARMAVLALTALAGAAAVGPAHAVLDIDINRGSVRPLPIALPAFVGGAADAQLGVDVASVIAADLGRSGLFLPVQEKVVGQRSINPDSRPIFADWTALSAQALVVGRIEKQSDGRL